MGYTKQKNHHYKNYLYNKYLDSDNIEIIPPPNIQIFSELEIL